MYKNIALLALLLPFSGYAITKQERKEQIMSQIAQIEKSLNFTVEIMKHNLWAVFIYPSYFKNEAIQARDKAIALQKELDEIDLALQQEQACTKN